MILSGLARKPWFFKKEIIRWGIIEVFLWPLWVPSNIRRFSNQNYVSCILGRSRTGQAKPLWHKGSCHLVIGLLSQCQGWLDVGQHQREVGLPEPNHPIASPVGPCCCWHCCTLVAPVEPLPWLALGTCPGPWPRAPLCPPLCCWKMLFNPCSCVPSPTPKCPDCVWAGAMHCLIPVPR